MENKTNIVLADTLVSKDWEFSEGLKAGSGQEWKIICWDNAGLKKNSFHTLKRIAGYFFNPLLIFLNRKKYKKIVAWQQFYGLTFAFYCNVFRVKKINPLIVMTFIYKEKKGLIGKIYHWFVKKVVVSDYIDKLVVFSDYEIDYYSKLFEVSRDKFQHFNLGIERKKKLPKTKLEIKSPFILSVGRSNRDYQFLIDSVRETDMNYVIITDELNYSDDIPSNIMILSNVRGDEYLKILEECTAVIIPLKDPNISSGQLVMLQAMQYEKCIIVTESDTISSYVKNDVNGIVIKKDAEFLKQAIIKITKDENYRTKLTKNGKDFFDDQFSLFALGKNISKLKGFYK